MDRYAANDFLEAASFKVAKSMPNIPHSYSLKIRIHLSSILASQQYEYRLRFLKIIR